MLDGKVAGRQLLGDQGRKGNSWHGLDLRGRFLFLGSHKVVQGAVEAVSQTWTCSKPMFASETEAITFCGLTSESTRNLKVLCCHNKPTNRSFGREGRAGVDWSSFMVEYKMPSGDHAVHVMSKHAVRENNF